jgi:hypothetical protein
MKTFEGLARFLACSKDFRNVLPDKGSAGYGVPMMNFIFSIAGDSSRNAEAMLP